MCLMKAYILNIFSISEEYLLHILKMFNKLCAIPDNNYICTYE